MHTMVIQDKTFDKDHFREDPIPVGEYENCLFTQVDFTGKDFSHCRFIDCRFVDCSISLVKLVQTVFRDCVFTGCKMLGLPFENCHDFGLSFAFTGCRLDNASFYKRSLKKIVFTQCSLQEVDFTETDLTAAVFDNCDLAKALFEHTILEKADLRTAYNYSIDPGQNRIKKAKFSLAGIPGLLHQYDILIDK